MNLLIILGPVTVIPAWAFAALGAACLVGLVCIWPRRPRQ